MAVEIAHKASKNRSMLRVIMELMHGMRFYIIEILTNDWDKDDCLVWSDYQKEYSFNKNKDVVMNTYNNI